jgi:hypothetical protein
MASGPVHAQQNSPTITTAITSYSRALASVANARTRKNTAASAWSGSEWAHFDKCNRQPRAVSGFGFSYMKSTRRAVAIVTSKSLARRLQRVMAAPTSLDPPESSFAQLRARPSRLSTIESQRLARSGRYLPQRNATNAAGEPLAAGYVKPLHLNARSNQPPTQGSSHETVCSGDQLSS